MSPSPSEHRALVLDASVLAEFLLGSTTGMAVAERITGRDRWLHVPHLAVVETTSVLRHLVRRRELESERAVGALEDLGDFPARRWPAEPFLERVWELRDVATAYDANYVALAEHLDGTLLTSDRRLEQGSRRHVGCDIEVIGSRS